MRATSCFDPIRPSTRYSTLPRKARQCGTIRLIRTPACFCFWVQETALDSNSSDNGKFADAWSACKGVLPAAGTSFAAWATGRGGLPRAWNDERTRLRPYRLNFGELVFLHILAYLLRCSPRARYAHNCCMDLVTSLRCSQPDSPRPQLRNYWAQSFQFLARTGPPTSRPVAAWWWWWGGGPYRSLSPQSSELACPDQGEGTYSKARFGFPRGLRFRQGS